MFGHSLRPDTVGQSLRWAAGSGDLEEVRRLLQPDPSKVDIIFHYDEMTTLHWATDGGHLEIVRYLLDMGADINREDRGGRTPLLLAAMNGHVGLVELLLARGARQQEWPLAAAAEEGHAEVVELLLRHSTEYLDLNYDCTALCASCMNGHNEVAYMLLAAGADPLIADEKHYIKDHLTPLQWARKNNHQGCVKLLEEWELPYRIIKARHLRDLATKPSHSKKPSKDTLKRKHTPVSLAKERKALPRVELVELVGKSTGGQGADEGALRREVVGYVLSGMKAEVFQDWARDMLKW